MPARLPIGPDGNVPMHRRAPMAVRVVGMNDTAPRSSARQPTSAALLARLRNDDTAALDSLLKQYWPPLVSYLTGWLGSADAAEDVTQRTFLRLWERRADWVPDGSLRALLFRIARNIAISDQRTVGARARAAARFVQTRASRREPTALDALENEELGSVLERAVQALPHRRREVFLLRCVHDLSYREIAATMGISQQTVANQLSRALCTLRDQLGELLDTR